MSELDMLRASIEQTERNSAARQDWQPKQVGNIDIRITSDGSWIHEGRAFQRQSLVKLFASVLRREGEEYYLFTPAQKLRIEVDDAPFVASLLEQIHDNGRAALVFTTNLGDKIIADQAHPIRVELDPDSGQPRPYIHYRDGLEALISRSAFFDLVNLAQVKQRDGKQVYLVTSLGCEFILGDAN